MVEALPEPARTPPELTAPGTTTSRLVPRLSICLRTASLAPWPTATMAISAATPMKTPSMVSAERVRLRPIAWIAAAAIISAKAQAAVARERGRRRFGVCQAPATPLDRPATRLAGSRPLVGDDQAVAHRHHAIGIGGDVRRMGHDDDGDAALAIELHQRFHDLMRGARIEIAGRLVRQQQARIVDQRAGDRDALLLPAGQLRRACCARGRRDRAIPVTRARARSRDARFTGPELA